MRKTMTAVILVLGLLLLSTGCNNSVEPEQEQAGCYGWAAGSALDGYGVILYTANAGTTWVRQGDAGTIPPVDINDVSAVDSLNAWAVGTNYGGYANILRATDGGGNWVRQGSAVSIPDVELEGVSAVNAQTVWAAGDSGVILKTTDGGATWVNQGGGIPGLIGFGMIQSVNSDIAWAGGGWALGDGSGDSVAVIYKTTDGGDTWVRKGEADIPADPGFTGKNFFIDIHAFNENVVWAVGTASGAFVTIDGGENWLARPTAMGFNHNNGVCAANEMDVWIAADYNNTLFTDDQGVNWGNQVMPSDSTAGGGYSMGITALDENIAWLVNSDFTGGTAFHTIDGGETWVIQALPANGDSQLRRVSFVGDLR